MSITQEEVNNIAVQISKSGFALPAMITLESLLPLHNLIAHLGECTEPLWQVCTGKSFGKFKELLRSREDLEALIVDLEHCLKNKRYK